MINDNKTRNKMNNEKFKERAYLVHGNRYDYSLVKYKNIDTKIKIICNNHGEFEMSPYVHLKGGNCIKCSNIRTSEQIKKSFDNFLEKARKIHGDLYDYSKVKYINSHTKITIIDPEYGEFEMRPYSHIQGQNHPKRGQMICDNKRKIGVNEFIKRANEKHNNLYDYSKVEYINSDTKVCIVHPIFGEFFQTPYQHVNKGSGHPKIGRKSENDMDHIIPIGIIVSQKNLNNIDKNRPLYKFLNSSMNLRKINMIDNKNKEDIIIISGKIYKASNIRNMYNMIHRACIEYLNIDIQNIIIEDKKYMDNILLSI